MKSKRSDTKHGRNASISKTASMSLTKDSKTKKGSQQPYQGGGPDSPKQEQDEEVHENEEVKEPDMSKAKKKIKLTKKKTKTIKKKKDEFDSEEEDLRDEEYEPKSTKHKTKPALKKDESIESLEEPPQKTPQNKTKKIGKKLSIDISQNQDHSQKEGKEDQIRDLKEISINIQKQMQQMQEMFMANMAGTLQPKPGEGLL